MSEFSPQKRSLGSALIASLTSLRDQLKVSSEGTLSVPKGTPLDEIKAFVESQPGIRQFYPGTVQEEGERVRYALVFDLAKIGRIDPAAAPSWLSQAKLETADGMIITTRFRE